MFPSFLSRKRRSGVSAEIRAGRTRKEQIQFPLGFSGRTSSFSGGIDAALLLQNGAPEAIAAPLNAALELAAMKCNGEIQLPSLSFALVVLTDPQNPHLSHEHRNSLWRAFQVPIFEHFCASDGTVLARECEIHDGLHVVPDAPARVDQGELTINGEATGLTALLDTGHCECGDENPRLTVGTRFLAREAAA